MDRLGSGDFTAYLVVHYIYIKKTRLDLNKKINWVKYMYIYCSRGKNSNPNSCYIYIMLAWVYRGKNKNKQRKKKVQGEGKGGRGVKREGASHGTMSATC